MSWLDQFVTAGYKTIQVNGVSVPQEPTLNVLGASAEDDPANFRTNLNLQSAENLSWISVLTYGAGSDQTGVGYRAAAITASTNTLTLSSPPGTSVFSGDDVGKAVQVVGAGADGADLYTTISGYTSPTSVTLDDPASTTVLNGYAFWYPNGQDDTLALQQAIDAANVNAGTVYLPARVYVISRTLVGSNFLRKFLGDGMLQTFIVVNGSDFTGDVLSFETFPRALTIQDLTLKHVGLSDEVSSATVTAWSVSGNIATFTSNNSFIVGQPIVVNGMFGSGKDINDCFGTVRAGVSPTSFSISLTAADGSGTDDGYAHLDYNCLSFGTSPDLIYPQISGVQAMVAPGDGFKFFPAIVGSVRNCLALRNIGNGFSFYNTLNATGTSISVEACYANANNAAGYYFNTMAYFSLAACAADGNGASYLFKSCHGFALNGCGSEGPLHQCAAFDGKHYRVRSSSAATLNGCYSTISTTADPNPGGTYLAFTGESHNINVNNFRCAGSLSAPLPTYAFDIGSACSEVTISNIDFDNFDFATAWTNAGTLCTVYHNSRFYNPVAVRQQADASSRITLQRDGSGITFSDGSADADVTVKRNSGNLELDVASGKIVTIPAPGALSADNTKKLVGSEAQGDILYFSGSQYARLAASTEGYVLTTHGASANPTWAATSGGSAATDLSLSGQAQGNLTYFNGANWVVLADGTSGQVLKTQGAAANPVWGLPGDLAIGSQAQGDILYFNGSNWVRLAAGASGKFLETLGASANPAWASLPLPTDLNITSEAQGDVLYFNGSNWVRLAAGTSGKFLETLGASANPAWASIPLPTDLNITSEAQGDVLYYNGANWVRLAAGTSGYFLKTQGGAANPAWAAIPLPTDLNITSEAQGDVLYYNGANWVRLGAGTSGQLLKTQGGSANPVWGLAADLSIASQAQGDVLYFNGSNWVRLGAGTSGQVLKTLGAAANPAWGLPADLAIASQAQGDILYFNGSNWVHLAAGTSGQFLKTQGAGANPVWGTQSGSDAWTTIMDLDFTAQSTQALSSNTNYTIGGYTWTKFNSSTDVTAITNLTGFVCTPFQTSDWSGTTYTFPGIRMLISQLLPNIDVTTKLRLWIYNSSQNSAANYDNTIAALFAATTFTGAPLHSWVGKRGVTTSGAGASLNPNIGTTNLGNINKTFTLGSSNNVMMIELPLGFDTQGSLFFGSWSAGWPTMPNMTRYLAYGLAGGDWIGAVASQIGIAIGGGRAGSGTAFTTTIANIRLDYQ